MLSNLSQDFIIMIFLIIAFFLLGLIIGTISNPRTKKHKGKSNDAAQTLIESDPEINNPAKENPIAGSNENISQRNGPYRRYPRNGYYNR